MPRIRTIKPDFFTSETVSTLPLRARLTWIGLWTHCDDHGRFRDNVKLIKAAVWPLDDVSLRDIGEDLNYLERAGLLFRYEASGRTYLQVTNWAEHQKVDRPSKSTIPDPAEGTVIAPSAAGVSAAQDTRGEARGILASPRESASNPRDRKGKEGKGREGTRASAQDAPPDRCLEHLEDPNPGPCGPCAGARKARERFDRERAAAIAAETQTAAHERAEANQLAIAACTLCDESGYVGTVVCPHDPGQADRTRKRAAETRNRLAGIAGGDFCPNHRGQSRAGCVHCHPEATT